MDKMRTFVQIAKNNPRSSASALKTSAAVPNSGFAFVDNSQGASAAVAELSVMLGDALHLIDLDGNTNEKIRKLSDDLDQAASKYENSSVDHEGAVAWKGTPEQAQLVSLAWKCALGVYTPEDVLANTETHRFQRTYYAAASATGIVRAMTCTVVQPFHPTSGIEPVLIIAVRGSASKIDHVVNANARPRGTNQGQALHGLTAHSGFLHSAEALHGEVSRQIRAYKDQIQLGAGEKCRIILTGHSAGGAVASLLYLLCTSSDGHPETRFSCITFGAPPSVASMPESPVVREPNVDDGTVCLNIINEFDVVARADPPYLLCVVNLLRSMYGLPALVRDCGSGDENKTTPSSDTEASVDEGWLTPPRFYHHVGDLVVLLTRLEGDDVRMRAVSISEPEFRRFLFCRLAVHHRVCYAERVALLEKGEFNGRDGWGGLPS